MDNKRAEALSELEILCEATRRPMPRIERTTPLRDIRYEIKRLLIVEERARAIKQMRIGVIFAASGCEMLNQQFGKPLELTGFARSTAHAASTEKRFDDVLHALYVKYWRRHMSSATAGSGGNPIAEICVGLAMSAATFHVSQMDLASLLPKPM